MAAPSRPPRDRVFTPPLTAFLGVVVLVVASALWHRLPCPDLEGAITLLADGDFDGDERDRMLRRVVADARQAPAVRARWAGLLAALALEDLPAWRELLLTFGKEPMPRTAPAAEARLDLDLGDPLLASVLAAGVAEAAGDHEGAITAWARAQVQARLAGRPFPRAVADAALQRLQGPARPR